MNCTLRSVPYVVSLCSADLVEVLEALVSECDVDAEDGVSGVLIKPSLTVTTIQSQRPTPTHTHTHINVWVKNESVCV